MRTITTWLEKRLGPTHQASSGHEITACCPICPDGDTGYHLYYNPTKNVWTCFKCGASGQGLDLVMQVDNVNALTAARVLSPHVYLPPKPVKSITELPEWYKPLLPKEPDAKLGWNSVYTYASNRGFSDSQIEFYGFGYAVGSYRHRNRLIIPVERGYYQARACNKSTKPRYINPDVPKADRLFNYRFLGSKHIAVCEGCISAIAATAKQDDPPALAILGKNITPEQSKRIVDSYPAAVDIAFDAGTETDDGTLEFASYLYSHDIAVIIRSYKFGDPDECQEYAAYTYKPSYRLKARLLRVRI